MSDPSILVTNPTHSDPSLAPDGKQIYYVLFPTPNLDAAIDWRTEGPRYRDEVVRTLEERGYIGFGDAIEVEHVTTPLDWQAPRAWSAARRSPPPHSFLQTGPFRPGNLWGENVVFTGSGTQPGVGVPMVLVSGRLAAERITGPDPALPLAAPAAGEHATAPSSCAHGLPGLRRHRARRGRRPGRRLAADLVQHAREPAGRSALRASLAGSLGGAGPWSSSAWPCCCRPGSSSGSELLAVGRARRAAPVRDILGVLGDVVRRRCSSRRRCSAATSTPTTCRGGSSAPASTPPPRGSASSPAGSTTAPTRCGWSPPRPYGPLFLLIERAIANFAHPNAYLGALLFRLVPLAGVALIAVLRAAPGSAARHRSGPRALARGAEPRAGHALRLRCATTTPSWSGSWSMGLALATERSASGAQWRSASRSRSSRSRSSHCPSSACSGPARSGGWLDRIRSWAVCAAASWAARSPRSTSSPMPAPGSSRPRSARPAGVLTWLSPTTAIGQLLGMLTTAVGLTANDATPLLTGVRLLGTAIGLVIILWLDPAPGRPQPRARRCPRPRRSSSSSVPSSSRGTCCGSCRCSPPRGCRAASCASR